MPEVYILRDSKERTEAIAEGVCVSAANTVRRRNESLQANQKGLSIA